MESIIRENRISIVGLGQLGASLAERLKELRCPKVSAVTKNSKDLDNAIRLNLIDRGSVEAADVLPNTDIVILCLPLIPTVEFVEQNIDYFNAGSIVTDIGSTKSWIVSSVRSLFLAKGVRFVGSHPMAGSEKSGMKNRAVNLYQDATVFLTPNADDDKSAVTLIRNFWTELGSLPVELNAQDHDRAVAYTSHSLHILAATVVNAVLNHADADIHALATAGGFRDLTRIASSDPNMWTQIFQSNTQNTLIAISDIQKQLETVSLLLQKQDWQGLHDYLEDARTTRNEWSHNRKQ